MWKMCVASRHIFKRDPILTRTPLLLLGFLVFFKKYSTLSLSKDYEITHRTGLSFQT
jgi:hypothetical protein